MGKIADVFGRLESFSISIFLYTIGYIQQAASRNVQTYAGAQIFWAAGFNGLQVLQQIFVADTTDLLNRALFSTIFDLPFLWTTWAGPEVANSILTGTSWRWGYGIWAIILPICFIPLAASLFMNQRRAKKLGLEFPSPFRGRTIGAILKNLWYDLDIFGLLLLAAGISLILLPLTLAPNASNEWRNPSMIAMLVIGGVTIIAFPFWETSKKLAPKAFFPPNLFKNRTVVAGFAIAFFYFSKLFFSPESFITLIWRSGFLHERVPLLLLISAHRPEQVAGDCRLHHSCLYVCIYSCIYRSVLDHQVHRTLQVLRYGWCSHLHHGLVSLTTLKTQYIH